MNAEMETEGFQYSVIDIGFEFDAPQFFHLEREELPSEVHQAELWFETAGNYPPSPLIVNLSVGKEGKHEILNTLLKLRDMDSSNTQMDVSNAPRNVYAFNGSSLLSGGLKGRTYGNFRHQDLSKDNYHQTFKGTDSSNSCFMKPTTSHLARKTSAQRSNRFHRPLSVQTGTSDDPIHGLLHAAKRQKVAGGLICKMVDTVQQSDLLHKNSKKECFSNCISHPTKLRLTIPKEPVLETARRAKTFRAQRSNQSAGKKLAPLHLKLFH
ncbi:hypothetical protein KSP40_PGU013976 [Platanthera guangdongensis]|uniref:Uncharacterized protein n=1 Tax=Platanthera guangdongensis TaxID=2320717 RepID=A0ABR2MNJ8_9ASPA